MTAASPWMTFLWPSMLWAMLALPLIVALYVLLLKRRKKTNLRYANLALVKEALGGRSAWRRHVPPALLFIALAVLTFSTSRPAMLITLPSAQETIVLAIDVSGSMRAADVQPNRLVAAQEAAKAFVAELPRNVKVAVVSFAGTAAGRAGADAQPRRRLRGDRPLPAAARHRDRQRHRDLAGDDLPRSRHRPLADHRRARDAAGAERQAAARVQAGRAGLVLVGSDHPAHRRPANDRPDSLDAAKMAADRGVKVFTVGIGTKEGETIGFEGWSMRVRLDEETLKAVAKATNAEYFYAGTAQDLKKVYQGLSTRLIVEKKETEITALLATIGALIVLVAAGLSTWWFGRIA
jgi:Ca-activated chloride channel family protein